MQSDSMSHGGTRETRRRFLATVAIVGGGFGLGSVSGLATASERPQSEQEQPRHGMIKPPLPAEPKDQNDTSPQEPNLKAAQRALRLKQEKEFREGVERLYALTGELRDELQKTPTTAVLSVHMYKKTEEIEKLAKQLKSKAKG